MRAWRPVQLMMAALIIRCGLIEGWRKEMEFEVEREKGTAWPLFLWLFANPLAATAPLLHIYIPLKSLSLTSFSSRFSLCFMHLIFLHLLSSHTCPLILPPKPRPSDLPSPLLWQWPAVAAPGQSSRMGPNIQALFCSFSDSSLSFSSGLSILPPLLPVYHPPIPTLLCSSSSSWLSLLSYKHHPPHAFITVVQQQHSWNCSVQNISLVNVEVWWDDRNFKSTIYYPENLLRENLTLENQNLEIFFIFKRHFTQSKHNIKHLIMTFISKPVVVGDKLFPVWLKGYMGNEGRAALSGPTAASHQGATFLSWTCWT